MATETITTQVSAPGLTYSIASLLFPLDLHLSMQTIQRSSNSCLGSPRSTTTGLAYPARGYTEPLRVRFAPIATPTDSHAHEGFEAVESRYSYSFKTEPKEITNYMPERRENLCTTIAKRVNSPADDMAGGIDQVTLHSHHPSQRTRVYRCFIIALSLL